MRDLDLAGSSEFFDLQCPKTVKEQAPHVTTTEEGKDVDWKATVCEDGLERAGMDVWKLHHRSANKGMLTRAVMLAMISPGSASSDKKLQRSR